MLIGNVANAICISNTYKTQKPSRAVPEKAFSYLLPYAVSVVTDPSDFVSLFTLLIVHRPDITGVAVFLDYHVPI
jgi:hypothetical protein